MGKELRESRLQARSAAGGRGRLTQFLTHKYALLSSFPLFLEAVAVNAIGTHDDAVDFMHSHAWHILSSWAVCFRSHIIRVFFPAVFIWQFSFTILAQRLESQRSMIDAGGQSLLFFADVDRH